MADVSSCNSDLSSTVLVWGFSGRSRGVHDVCSPDGKKGWYRRDKHGDDIGFKNYNLPEESKKALWEHSWSITDV
ncbi:hypothetical protein BDZ89DRAFT_1248196, partial [Hymenopellis radicata]